MHTKHTPEVFEEVVEFWMQAIAHHRLAGLIKGTSKEFLALWVHVFVHLNTANDFLDWHCCIGLA